MALGALPILFTARTLGTKAHIYITVEARGYFRLLQYIYNRNINNLVCDIYDPFGNEHNHYHITIIRSISLSEKVD